MNGSKNWGERRGEGRLRLRVSFRRTGSEDERDAQLSTTSLHFHFYSLFAGFSGPPTLTLICNKAPESNAMLCSAPVNSYNRKILHVFNFPRISIFKLQNHCIKLQNMHCSLNQFAGDSSDDFRYFYTLFMYKLQM